MILDKYRALGRSLRSNRVLMHLQPLVNHPRARHGLHPAPGRDHFCVQVCRTLGIDRVVFEEEKAPSVKVYSVNFSSQSLQWIDLI